MNIEDTLILFSSEKGNTEYVAMHLAKALSVSKKNVQNVSKIKGLDLSLYKNIVLGCSTWNADILPYDFKQVLNIIENSSLEGKNIAIFGTGNQYEYPHSFVSAIGLIYNELKDKSCRFVGQTNCHGYEFVASKAKIGSKFIGLAIDEEIQPELTQLRIKKWAQQLQNEFAMN